ncbi:UPF0231 family protein [Paraglaciecola aestuariivivens]
MDYQFSRNLLGQAIATCELECEAFGDWLTNDLGSDKTQIKALIEIINKLQNQELNHYQHVGKDYHLELDTDEVELSLNNTQISDPNFNQEEHLGSDNTTGCGLTDLLYLLNAWLDYLS